MKQYLKFLLYVSTVIVLVALAVQRAGYDSGTGRYQFQSQSDGEIIRYDTATGHARTVRHGTTPDSFKFDSSDSKKVLPPSELETLWWQGPGRMEEVGP